VAHPGFADLKAELDQFYQPLFTFRCLALTDFGLQCPVQLFANS
jgi:hypothetical protein